jgi:hypothetical protein
VNNYLFLPVLPSLAALILTELHVVTSFFAQVSATDFSPDGALALSDDQAMKLRSVSSASGDASGLRLKKDAVVNPRH